MDLNFEQLQLFIEGMKISREQHGESSRSYELGVNGRLISHQGKLSFSSIEGTVEIYNDSNVIKYLGYCAFQDEVVLFVKYNTIPTNFNIDTQSISVITSDNIEIDIPFGSTVHNFTTELTDNANEDIMSSQFLNNSTQELIDNPYSENDEPEELDLESYYILSNSSIPNFALCPIDNSSPIPEYNQNYSDAIIVLKKNNDATLTPRIAWHGYLNWDINRKITTVGIFENNYYKRVYFTDNLNPLRVLNLKDNDLSFRTLEEFDINHGLPMLQPFIDEINENGAIKAMSVQYAYRLITENGQTTNFSPYSDLVKILIDDEGYDFTGGLVDDITNKSVVIKCPVLNQNYKDIQCVAIEFEGEGTPTTIRDLGINAISNIVTFIHYGNEPEFGETLTLEEIVDTTQIWKYCEDITTKNNKLIAGGLRNEPYLLQQKYIEDLFLLKGYDVNGNSHNSMINPEPQNYQYIDITNTEESVYLKKQLYKKFLFFGNFTLTFKNTTIPGSEEIITFSSTSEEYLDYIEEIWIWLNGLTLTNFPNLQITRVNNNILFEPIDDQIQTDFSNYIFESSISQSIIDFDNEYGLLQPTIDPSKIVYGAQSHGFNRGAGVRFTWEQKKEAIMNKSSELYESGPVLDLETPSLKKTFVKDEIYRTSITLFKNGSPLFAIVLGDIKVPAIGDWQAYIDEQGNYQNWYTLGVNSERYSNQSVDNNQLMVHRMELRAEVRIPCSIKKYIDSYQIQYVERTEENRTILAQGISAPLERMMAFLYPQLSVPEYAESVALKWTLPYFGGPAYHLHGLIPYDDPDMGENFDDLNSWTEGAPISINLVNKIRRRIITNRRMFYFDSPDLINGLVSDKNIKNANVNILGRLNTDHNLELIRARFPDDEIHEGYRYPYTPANYNSSSFSRKIGYSDIGSDTNAKPYHVNISVFSNYSYFNKTHQIEKATPLLNKGEIIPGSALFGSFEFSNQALIFFAQHAINSSLFLQGSFTSSGGHYKSNNHKSAQKSEGYPTVFIRTTDDVFTNDFIGDHINNPVYSRSHLNDGNEGVTLNLDFDNISHGTGAGERINGVPISDSHALVNLKLENENSIYGGRTKYAFSNNIFIPLSKVIPIQGSEADNRSQIFNVEGDFYTSLYIRTKNDMSVINDVQEVEMHQNTDGGENSTDINDYNRGGAWAYAVILETEIESRLSGDYRFYRSESGVDFTPELNEFINAAYLKKNNLRIYSPKPYNFKDEPLLTNQLSASKVKLFGDYIDAWTTFLTTDFYELDRIKGRITNVTNWGDQIYVIQERESNMVYIDGKQFINTEEGQRVAVSEDNQNTFTDHKKISDFGTSIRRALAEGEFGFSFFDEHNKAFIKIDKPISLQHELETKLHELFDTDQVVDTEGYYDDKNKETNIRIRTIKGNVYCLSYNEALQVFNGYFTYDNDIYIMFDKRVFAPITETSTVTIEEPVITSSLAISENHHEYFEYQIVATNNPTSYGVENLPDGLAFNPQTGLIFGTVQNLLVYNITISATNQAGTDTETLVLTMLGSAPSITSVCPSAYNVGDEISYQITADNYPIYFNVTGLPAGLSVSPEGLITGSVASAGSYPITITAGNGAGEDTQPCTLVINAEITGGGIISQTSSSSDACDSIWEIQVAASVGTPRQVKIKLTAYADAVYSDDTIPNPFVQHVSEDIYETINSTVVYRLGINGDNTTTPLADSTIKITVYENSVVIDTLTLTRNHGPGNC